MRTTGRTTGHIAGQRGRAGFVLALATLLLASQAVVAFGARPGEPQDPAADAATDYHVVTFKQPPAVKAVQPERGQGFEANSPAVEQYRGQLRDVHRQYIDWLQARAPEVEVVRDLTLAANAIAVRLNGADPGLLARGPGAKQAAPSDLYRPTMNASVEIIGADEAWGTGTISPRAAAGFGVKVGVIDTGIYDQHEFFADCGKTIQHHGPYVSGTTGIADDLGGGGVDIVFDHGTHVAGTVGGCVLDEVEVSPGVTVDTISGVAPGVQLHDYNVFPGYGAGFVAFGGSAFSHDIAAAIEDAIVDGMDIINLSLGGGVQGPHDFLAEVVDAAAEVLIPVVAAGNSGDAPGTVESPGSAPGAITVGATTNSHIIALEVEVDLASTTAVAVDHSFAGAVGDFGNFVDEGPDETYDGDTAVSGATIVPWTAVTGSDDALACAAAGSSSLLAGANEIALISRGTCAFSTKVQTAEDAGAEAVIVYNNLPGDPISMAATPGIDTTIPATMISLSDGQLLLDDLDDVGETATASIAGPAAELDAMADVMAGFSSRGPTPFAFTAKPDLAAPGVNVISSVATWDPQTGTYDVGWAPFGGTSMATPHVAGAAALLLEAGFARADVKSALVNHAEREGIVEWVTDDADPSGFSLQDAGVLDRGGGRLDVPASLAATAFASPTSVSFGRITGNKPATITRTVDVSATCTDVTADGDGVSASLSGTTVTATFDSAGLGSGSYEGDVTVTCDGPDPVLPWFALVDRRGSG